MRRREGAGVTTILSSDCDSALSFTELYLPLAHHTRASRAPYFVTVMSAQLVQTWLLVSQSLRSASVETAASAHEGYTHQRKPTMYSPAGRFAGTRTSSSIAVFFPICVPSLIGFLP